METFKPIKDYLREKYASHQERADLYAYFLERGANLLRPQGGLGMIVSNKFIRAKYGAPLRAFLAASTRLRTIADFAGARVFVGATVRTVVLLASRQPCDGAETHYVPVPDADAIEGFTTGRMTVADYAAANGVPMASNSVAGSNWRLGSAETSGLLDRMKQGSIPLARFLGSTAAFGLKTGLNVAFILDRESRDAHLKRNPKCADLMPPILFGRDVRRYATAGPERFVIYISDEEQLEGCRPVREHLTRFRAALSKRAGGQSWFELQQPAAAVRQRAAAPKIVYPIIAPECRFTVDRAGRLINDKLFMLDSADPALLAVLNSRLANFYFSAVCASLEGGTQRYLEFRAQYVDKFPLPKAFGDFKGRKSLGKLADGMMYAHERLAAARSPDEKVRIKRQIDATDRQIDQLVYELYGLDDDDIGILDGAPT